MRPVYCAGQITTRRPLLSEVGFQRKPLGPSKGLSALDSEPPSPPPLEEKSKHPVVAMRPSRDAPAAHFCSVVAESPPLLRHAYTPGALLQRPQNVFCRVSRKGAVGLDLGRGRFARRGFSKLKPYKGNWGQA